MTTFNIDAKEILEMADAIKNIQYDDVVDREIYAMAITSTIQAMLDNLGADDVRKMPGFSSNLRSADKHYGRKPAPVFANHAPHGVPPSDRD